MKYGTFIQVLVVILIGVSGMTARGGELTPPAGAIADTDAVLLNAQWTTLPYTITQSGTYRFTSNLTGVAGQVGIIIDADDVTIDLNGFTLQGVAGSTSGIIPTIPTTVGSVTHQGARIINGHINGWGNDGVSMLIVAGVSTFSYLENTIIENLIVRDCGKVGIRALSGFVRGCVVTNCGFAGIVMGRSEGVIEHCTVTGSGSDGIIVSSGAQVWNCISNSNGGSGITSGTNSIIQNCTIEGNGSSGIRVLGGGAMIERCTIRNNTQHGIQINANTSIRECRILLNGSAGVFGDPATVGQNHIENNFISNNGTFGIDLTGNTDNAVFRNVLRNNTIGALSAAGSDAPLSASSAGAGPWDNIGN